ncbi:RluA family pseudouridine synthase [soil metagenome]
MPKPLTVDQPTELLTYLFASWPEVSRTQVRQWLKNQSVAVNGRPVTQFNHPLNPGDTVVVHSGKFAAPQTSIGSGIKIVFEDDTLIVIEKPSGLLSMASEAEQDKTAYAFLTAHVRRGQTKSRTHVWIVHRLDRETSGLMVFAKTPEAKASLQTGWDKNEKRYQAVIEGHMPAQQGTLKSDLDESNPFKVFIVPPSLDTRHAVTHYRVIKRGPLLSLVELTLETGRRHQIRVQLASVHCPIIGDEKYGAQTNPAKRLGLHSCFLRFSHPQTCRELSFTSPLPKALAQLA